MIAAKELRIGNLHLCRPLNIPRMGISSDGVCSITGFGIHIQETNPSEELAGIPLTEEWLIKFGFEKNEAEAPGIAIWDEFNIGRFIIANHGTGLLPFHFVPVNGKVIDIKYVHQLQNLYFAVTGEELETDFNSEKIS